MKTVICEACGDEEATSFSWFKDENKWKFCGACTRDTEHYYIEFKRFFRSPECTVDWLAHMNEKNWMDWKDFMAMMDRFRTAAECFWKL